MERERLSAPLLLIKFAFASVWPGSSVLYSCSSIPRTDCRYLHRNLRISWWKMSAAIGKEEIL